MDDSESEDSDDDPLDDAEESSVVEILWLPLLEIDVACVVTLVLVKLDGVVYPESG